MAAVLQDTPDIVVLLDTVTVVEGIRIAVDRDHTPLIARLITAIQVVITGVADTSNGMAAITATVEQTAMGMATEMAILPTAVPTRTETKGVATTDTKEVGATIAPEEVGATIAQPAVAMRNPGFRPATTTGSEPTPTRPKPTTDFFEAWRKPCLFFVPSPRFPDPGCVIPFRFLNES